MCNEEMLHETSKSIKCLEHSICCLSDYSFEDKETSADTVRALKT